MIRTWPRLNAKLLWGAALAVALLLAFSSRASAAACTAPATSYGTVTSSVTVPATANYRIWTRMSAPTSSANTYLLQVDTSTCYNVGGSTVPVTATANATHFTTGSSNWINVTSTGSTVDLNLTAGTHTLTMIGNAQDVIIDRILLIQDNADGSSGCNPTDAGDNCANPPDTNGPVVSITSPADAATVSSPMTVAVSATDDSGTVSKVELYVDGASTPTASDTSTPFSFANLSLAPGPHQLRAKAYDPTGNASLSSVVNVTVSDTTKPTVSLTAPTNGSTISGTTSLTATASDNVGVTKVDFSVDGTVKNSDSASPYAYSLDTTTLTNASHTITATAYDAAGNNLGSSATVTVNNASGGTDTSAPTISPLANLFTGITAVAGASYTLSPTITDASGLQQVIFQIDGVTKQSTAATSYTFDTRTLTNGTHTLGVKATDNSTAHNATGFVTTTFKITDLADVNRNCTINFTDISAVIPHLGTTGTNLGVYDVNVSNSVNFTDISAVIGKIGTTPC
jgi:hypothetical protein